MCVCRSDEGLQSVYARTDALRWPRSETAFFNTMCLSESDFSSLISALVGLDWVTSSLDSKFIITTLKKTSVLSLFSHDLFASGRQSKRIKKKNPKKIRIIRSKSGSALVSP